MLKLPFVSYRFGNTTFLEKENNDSSSIFWEVCSSFSKSVFLNMSTILMVYEHLASYPVWKHFVLSPAQD